MEFVEGTPFFEGSKTGNQMKPPILKTPSQSTLAVGASWGRTRLPEKKDIGENCGFGFLKLARTPFVAWPFRETKDTSGTFGPS